jgi:hypothetical protein
MGGVGMICQGSLWVNLGGLWVDAFGIWSSEDAGVYNSSVVLL